jgi:hypothetical protein
MADLSTGESTAGDTRRPSMSGHQRPHRGASDSWLTPPEILRAVADAGGWWDLDPAAAVEHPTWTGAARWFTAEDDGLSQEWKGYVWCNPPFGPQTGVWLERMADHGNGVALCAARTETRWFVRSVWGRAQAVLFLHGRPHFYRPPSPGGGAPSRADANSGAPICLVAYGSRAVRALAGAALEGTLVLLAPVAELKGERWTE